MIPLQQIKGILLQKPTCFLVFVQGRQRPQAAKGSRRERSLWKIPGKVKDFLGPLFLQQRAVFSCVFFFLVLCSFFVFSPILSFCNLRKVFEIVLN